MQPVTERFIPVQVTTERAEVERTCAALEASSIPVLVEHISVTSASDERDAYPGYRILTARSSEQRARAIIGRAMMMSSTAAA